MMPQVNGTIFENRKIEITEEVLLQWVGSRISKNGS